MGNNNTCCAQRSNLLFTLKGSQAIKTPIEITKQQQTFIASKSKNYDTEIHSLTKWPK
jgi:hypothetical protein